MNFAPALDRQSRSITLDHLPELLTELDIPQSARRQTIGTSYSAEEVSKARQALTLGVKLSHHSDPTVGSLPYSYSALLAGLKASFQGETSPAVQAEFLSQALVVPDPLVWSKALEAMRRKFSDDVIRIVIEHSRHSLDNGSYSDWAELANDTKDLEQLNMPAFLTLSGSVQSRELKPLGIWGSSLPNQTALDNPLDRAFRLAQTAYQDVDRKRGISELQPMMQHATDVALLLSMAGSSEDLVIAGLLHDLLEGYRTYDGNEIPRGYYASEVENLFGGNVRLLIEAVTEPPKSELPTNWRERKLAVLHQVKGAGQEVATLLTASKISTFSDANAILWRGGRVEDWSKAGLDENFWVMQQYLNFAVNNDVPEVLVKLLQLEAARFLVSGREAEQRVMASVG